MPTSSRALIGPSRIAGAALAALACLVAVVTAPPADAAAPAGATPKVESLVAAMTQDEKLEMLSGWPVGRGRVRPDTGRAMGVGWIPGVKRLGVPDLTFTDGPAGVRIQAPTTALPAPIALGATFDPALATEYGTVLGRDARARDQDVLFGPVLNTVRAPQGGRNFESYGEDPHLISSLGVPETQAVQAQGTIATVKHFVANNQETERYTIDTRIDDRTLGELELRGFRNVVTRAHPAAAMCAYNKVNGVFACENPTLMNGTLRQQWGFDGMVVSDYFANHSAGRAVRAGLDVEFLGLNFTGLGSDLIGGTVTQAQIDGAVGHILTAMDRFGLLANASPTGGTAVTRPVPAFDEQGGAAVARAVADRSAVLLKNDGALPLADDQDVAVIGTTGRALLPGGGGSSHVVGVADREVSPLQALRDDGVRASFSVGRDLQGVTIPVTALKPPVPFEGRGLRRDFAGDRYEAVDLTGANALPQGRTPGWSGRLVVPETGDYTIAAQTSGVIGSIFLDGEQITSTGVNDLPQLATALRTTTDGLTNTSKTLTLTKGEHDIHVLTLPFPGAPPVIDPFAGPVQVKLAWITPEQRRADLGAAVDAAKKARTAVVFVHQEGTEGSDLASLSLPDGQDELVSAVARANPRTVVVLGSGYPALMPWLQDVAGVLDVWYPGQEGGRAISGLLTGATTPSGKLPVTFPSSEKATPVAGDEKRYPGVDGQVTYSEGVFSGYRWYDAEGVTPLFPFGFGLSYTTFGYSGLTVTGDTASFTVTNTGDRKGAEVAQVYAGRPADAPVAMPVRQLAGTARVTLDPGESRRVTVELDAESLSYWDAHSGAFVRPPGDRTISVGGSSRDLPLSAVLG